MSARLVLSETISRRIRREAERLGLSVEEYIVELLSQNLDPKSRVREYIQIAEELLEEAREELRKGDVRQSAEKVWGAAALTVKAYAYWRDGKRLVSHGELWEYKRRLEEELGEWVSDSWNAASAMHVCFYEGWCARRDVEVALKRVERMVKEVSSLLARSF